MKLSWIAIGFLLLVASIMAPVAQAATPYGPSPIIITPNKCEFVQVTVEDVLVENGQTATAYAMIKNNSDRVFYLDDAQWELNNSFATIQKDTTTLSVAPGQTGLAKATIKASPTSSGANASGTLQVKGHLDNGQYCDSQSIEAVPFKVQVKPLAEENACNDFQLFVPKEVEFEKGKSVTINVAYQNDSDRSATLSIHNNFANVTPAIVGVGPHQSGNVTITVSDSKADQSWTFFDVRQSGCDDQSWVSLMQVKTSEDKTPTPTTPVVSLIGIDADTNYNTRTGEYEVTIRLTNTNNQAITGSIGVIVPQNWGVESAKNITIPANKTVTARFNANPNGLVSIPQTGKVLFTYPNQTTTEKTIVFAPTVGGAGLAFAFLGDNWPWLGLLLLLLLLLFLFGGSQAWSKKTTTTTTLTTTPATVVPAVEEESTGEPHVWETAKHPLLPETHVTTEEAREMMNEPSDSGFEDWLDRQLEKMD